MKIKNWVLVFILLLGFGVFWDYVDYNTELDRISTIYDIPRSYLEEKYPFVPFTDLPSDNWIRFDAPDFTHQTLD